MTFALDRYEPIAFHTYPALMRAAEARTEVLNPTGPAAPTRSAEPPTMPVDPAEVTTVAAKPVATPRRPAEPVDAYLVGIDGTAVLRSQLADFLDAAGARRDVRVSVGVGSGSIVEWVLRSAVPYGVRALPFYPVADSAVDPAAAAASAAAAVAAVAAGQPDRRRLLILIWDRPPVAACLLDPPASTLVLHCVDAEFDRLPPGWGPSWLLARSRHRPRRSLLAHAGQLLDGWEPFREVPDGLVLARLG